MRHVIFPINGENYGFLYNTQAMFELEESFGDAKQILEIAGSDTEYLKVLRICEVLSIQSAAAKAEMGQPEHKVLLKSKILPVLSPVEFFKLKTVIATALNAGLSREIEQIGEIDLGLIELQKKTEMTDTENAT